MMIYVCCHPLLYVFAQMKLLCFVRFAIKMGKNYTALFRTIKVTFPRFDKLLQRIS